MQKETQVLVLKMLRDRVIQEASGVGKREELRLLPAVERKRSIT